MANNEMNLIMNLKGDLEKSLAKINQQLVDTEKNINRSNKSFAGTFKEATKPLNEFISVFRKVGFYAGVTIGALQLAMDNLKKTISEVDEVATQFGVSSSDMSKQMYGFDVATNSARIGVNAYKDDLNALGRAGVWLSSVLAKLRGTADVINAVGQNPALGNMSFDEASAEVLRKQRLANQNSPEVAKVRAGLYTEMQKNELSETDFKRKQLQIRADSLKKWGVEAGYVNAWLKTETNILDKDRTRELMKNNANRLKSEGETLKAMKIEQDLAFDAYVDKVGGDGELVAEFQAGQEAMLRKARETALGITAFWDNMASDMSSNFSSIFGDAFRGELKSAKDYFKSFALSIADNFSQMISKMITNMIMFGNASGQGSIGGGVASFLTSAITSYFTGGIGAGTGAGTGGWSPATQSAGDFVLGSYHRGGQVRKAHTGYLASDEIPLIAQTGEGILSRKGMSSLGRAGLDRANRGESGMGGGVNITIAPVIQAWDASDVYRNRKTLSDVIAQDIMNNGQMRKVIQQAR